MNTNNLIPLIVTDKLAETRAFYVEQMGFELTTDTAHYVQVRCGQRGGPELAFIQAEAACALGRPKPFPGHGLVLSIPTESADRKFEAVRGTATILAEPADKPWGWRSFLTVDPSGVVLDFFHVLEQSPLADATG